jgi:GT2 family glycosyltransferase
MKKDLTISIVNYNMKNSMLLCLKSIYANIDGLDVDVYVVDNNSADGSVDAIKREYPNVHLIANSDNRGFARANNQVLRVADSGYYLILNPDVTIFPGTLKSMMAFMENTPDAGMAGCKVLNSDGTLQYSCRRYPNIITIIWRALLLDLFFRNNRIINTYLMKDWGHDKVMPVNWLTGCCLMIRKETIDDVGLMSEKYFLYFEDADLCYRVNERWKVYYLPDIHIVHEFQHRSRKFGHLWHTLHHIKSAYHFFSTYGIAPKNGRR